jgi:hypothetical protein
LNRKLFYHFFSKIILGFQNSVLNFQYSSIIWDIWIIISFLRIFILLLLYFFSYTQFGPYSGHGLGRRNGARSASTAARGQGRGHAPGAAATQGRDGAYRWAPRVIESGEGKRRARGWAGLARVSVFPFFLFFSFFFPLKI